MGVHGPGYIMNSNEIYLEESAYKVTIIKREEKNRILLSTKGIFPSNFSSNESGKKTMGF
jgi:hypothetical protein